MPSGPARASPANLSRAPRWASAPFSLIWSDWPWTTTRRFADLGEDAHGGGAAAQVGTAASVRTQAAGKDQFSAAVELLHLGTRLQRPCDGRVAGVELEDRLRGGALGAAADGAGVGPGTQQEPDGGDHHGLAGTGLAGHHAQARGPAAVWRR